MNSRTCVPAAAEQLWTVVDGVRIGFLRAGSGPALILLHGLIGSAANWEQNISALAEVRTVYALDQVNMGASEHRRELDPGLAASADRIVRWMDTAGIAGADVAGSSHGGAMALMLAARRPDRVRSLVLFSPANPFCELGRGLIRFYNTRPGTWLARAIPHMPRLFHDIAHRRVYGDARKATQSALAGYTRSLNSDSIHFTMGIVRGWWQDMEALRVRLPDIAPIPALLFWGDRDRVVSLASGRTLAGVLRAELVEIPGAGHLPFAEEPELCNRTMIEWLARGVPAWSE